MPNIENEDWEKKVKKTKRRHRPYLGSNWSNESFHSRFPKYVEQILSTPTPHLPSSANKLLTNIDCGTGPSGDGTAYPIYVDAGKISVQEFGERFEQHLVPAVICNIPTVENWRASERWSDVYKWSQQRDNENVSSDTLPLLNREFKCGESDHGNTLRLKLSHFLSYARNNKDDSPLYVFDGTFDDDKASKTLLDDYSPPSFFQEDLFHLVGERRRPPYRWWLLGPERSGTTVHIDPLGTSAWNTLIVGKKRWVLFPPDTPKDVVKSKKLFLKSEDDEAVNYFCDLLPRLKEKHRDLQIYEFTQNPGDTLYVPSGWWHAVVNLTDTVAITQNFCSRWNFDVVWRDARRGRKKMSVKWLDKLNSGAAGEVGKKLGRRAVELNELDGFVMGGDDKKKEKEKKKKKGEKEKEKKKKKEGKREASKSVSVERNKLKKSRKHSGTAAGTDYEKNGSESS